MYQKEVDFIELTVEETRQYKQEWFEKIVPEDQQKRAVDCYCFDKDGYCGYLWHVFSYEILDCLVDDEANRQFDNLDKHKGILLMSFTDKAYFIKDVSRFKAKNLEIFQDVILTGYDFSWTYVKTHETDCGPYFYAVSSELIR